MSDEKHYVVTTASTRRPGEIVLRLSPKVAERGNFWTDDPTAEIWKMDMDTAREIVARLSHNQPNIMRYEKAIKRLEDQIAARNANRQGLTMIGRDGSSTFMPRMDGSETEQLMRQAGLGAMLDRKPGAIDPFAMLAGMQKFEKLAGIRRAPPGRLDDVVTGMLGGDGAKPDPGDDDEIDFGP